MRIVRSKSLASGLRALLGAVALAATLGGTAQAKEGWPRGLDLEDALARADLVAVVRVADVSERKVVHGGKAVEVSQQFAFTPAKILKGVFARTELALTNADLGTGGFTDADSEIARGQTRLLILGRSDRGYANANPAGDLDTSIPPLQGPDDPFVASAEALIAVGQDRDRAGKAAKLVAALGAAEGPGAVPLLRSLARRAVWAAQTPGAMEAVARRLAAPEPAVREAAAQAAQALLEADYLRQPGLRAAAVAALAGAVAADAPDVSARVAVLDALGATGADPADARVAACLAPGRAGATFAEQAARLRAAGLLKADARREAAAAYLDNLPLDAPEAAAEAAARTLARLAPEAARDRLAARFARKQDAGLDARTEIALLGEQPPAIAVPALLAAAAHPLDPAERLALAAAAARAADARLVPVLAGWLDPRRPGLRWHAVEALRRIDTDEAARILRPHLAEEPDLARKLQLAELLGRHGIRDGYPYAIEHMSEEHLREPAVAALGAIREPKAVDELARVLATSHDAGWNRAAVRALGRLGRREFAARFLAIARDPRNPVAPAALVALGDLGEAQALPIVREVLSSRNDEVAAAAARAAARLLAAPDAQADDVRDRLAALLADADAGPPVRSAAFDALVALKDPRLDRALEAASRDAGLERDDLLRRVEEQLAARKVALGGR